MGTSCPTSSPQHPTTSRGQFPSKGHPAVLSMVAIVLSMVAIVLSMAGIVLSIVGIVLSIVVGLGLSGLTGAS
jgi:hypothetical protein